MLILSDLRVLGRLSYGHVGSVSVSWHFFADTLRLGSRCCSRSHRRVRRHNRARIAIRRVRGSAASCRPWLGEEGPDRRGDDFGLAAAVGWANVGGATVIKAAENGTPVV